MLQEQKSMTLAELIAVAQGVNAQISTAWIPLKHKGKTINISLTLVNDDENGYAVDVEIN